MTANKTKSLLAAFLAVLMLFAVLPVSALAWINAENHREPERESVGSNDLTRGDYSSTTLEAMTARAEAIVNYRWTPTQDIATWNDNAYNGLNYFPAGSTVVGEPYTLFTSEVVSWSLCSLEQYANVASSNYSATAYCNSTSATRTGPVYGSCCVDLVCEVFGGSFMNGSNTRYHNVSAIRNSDYATTITGQKMADIKAGDAVSDTTKAHIIWVGNVTDTQITIYEQTPPVARKVVLNKASYTDANGYFVYGGKQYSVITRSNAANSEIGTNSTNYTPRLAMTPSDAPAYYTTLNVFYQCGYGMPNCTCYAFGRAYELLGTVPNLCHNNAGDWYDYNINHGYYPYGQTPKLGAIAVWKKTGGAGHVAVVEVIDGDTVITSESAWKGTYFFTKTRSASNSNFSQSSSYQFQGFIYVLDDAVPPPVPDLVSDSTYAQFRGFKGYLCTSDHVVCYNRDLTTSPGRIYTTDYCTINDVYTNGWCQVSCPWSGGGTKIVYTQISNFIKAPASSYSSFTASDYMNLYKTASLSAQIFRVYPGDVCYITGTSGSAMQILMPHSAGYYVLGWISDPGSIPPIDQTYPTPFNCYIISNVKVPVYSSPGVPYVVNGAQQYVYVDDDCVVKEVYLEPNAGWCLFDCPWTGGGTKTLYIQISEFVHFPKVNNYQMTAPRYAKTYLKSDGATEKGWIDAGDTIYVLSVEGNMTQIVYPATTTTGKRCGWVYTSDITEQFTVSYNANGGSGAPASQTKLSTSDLVLSSTIPTRTGYVFNGWGSSASSTTASYYPGSVYSTNADITLYAVWSPSTYTVTFDGSTVGQQQYHIGDSITLASDCEPADGYTHTGWYLYRITDGKWFCSNVGWKTDEEIDNNSFDLNVYSLGANMTIDGSWIYGLTGNAEFVFYPVFTINTYTVTFKDWDGAVLKTQQVEYGSSATAPADPTREGYTFIGWDVDFSNVTSDLIVTALYQQNTPEPTTPPNPNAVHFSVGEVNAIPGSDVSVDFSINGEFEASGLTVYISYDADKLTLNGITKGQVWYDLIDLEANVMSNTAAAGSVRFMAISPSAYFTTSGTILTMSFHVKDEVELGTDVPITIDVREFFVSPVGGTDTPIPFVTDNGVIHVNYILGDVNGDGELNGSDVILIMRYVLGIIDLDDTQQAAADYNGDGQINASDALAIMRKVLGII